MNDCIFCKIVRGEIPATKVFESDHLIAFLDIHPINLGHTLVVPREHYATILETPDEVVADMMHHMKIIARAAMEAVGAPAFNLGVNTGAEAGQIVMHAHMHVMPRFANDGHTHWLKREVSEAQMDEVATKMRELLR